MQTHTKLSTQDMQLSVIEQVNARTICHMNEHCFKRQMLRRTIQRSAPAKGQHIYMHDGAHAGKLSQGIQTQANHIKGLIHTFRALLLAQKPYVGASASALSLPSSGFATTLPTTLLLGMPMLRMLCKPITTLPQLTLIWVNPSPTRLIRIIRKHRRARNQMRRSDASLIIEIAHHLIPLLGLRVMCPGVARLTPQALCLEIF